LSVGPESVREQITRDIIYLLCKTGIILVVCGVRAKTEKLLIRILLM